MNAALSAFERPFETPPATWASFPDFAAKFGYNPHRARLIEGLRRAASELRRAGCGSIYVGGSFTSDKAMPSDYDACFNPIGVAASLSPLLVEARYLVERRSEYFGDWLIGRPDDGPAGYWYRFLSFDDRTGANNQMYGIKLSLAELSA